MEQGAEEGRGDGAGDGSHLRDVYFLELLFKNFVGIFHGRDCPNGLLQRFLRGTRWDLARCAEQVGKGCYPRLLASTLGDVDMCPRLSAIVASCWTSAPGLRATTRALTVANWT